MGWLPVAPSGWFRFRFFSLLLLLWAAVACGGGAGGGAVAGEEAAKTATTPVVVTKDLAAKLNPSEFFQLGIEREVESEYANTRRRRLALFVNNTSLSTRGVHTAELLSSNVLVSVSSVVVVDDLESSPTAALSAWIQANRRIPLFRVTPGQFRIPLEAIENADLIVWDVAVSGTRMALDAAVLGTVLERASLDGIPMLVLDRPSVISTDKVDGPISDLIYSGTKESFLPIPPVFGLTAGELARLYNQTFGLEAQLTILAMENWKRSDGNRWLDDPQWELPADRLAALSELRGTAPYQHGVVLLRAVRTMVGDGAFSSREIVRAKDGSNALLLVPREVPAATMLEKLTASKLTGVSFAVITTQAGAEALAITATEGEIATMELTLALRSAANPNPSRMLKDSQPVEFAADSLLVSLGRGLKPEQLRRRWQTSPDYLKYVANRSKVLLYEP
jgi:hypothetical protein